MVNVNLVQKLYGELNEARNDFLHGNPVIHSRLFCFCNDRRRSLIEIAPVIYKVALSCFFGQFGNTRGKSDEEPNYKALFDRHALENALLARNPQFLKKMRGLRNTHLERDVGDWDKLKARHGL